MFFWFLGQRVIDGHLVPLLVVNRWIIFFVGGGTTWLCFLGDVFWAMFSLTVLGLHRDFILRKRVIHIL